MGRKKRSAANGNNVASSAAHPPPPPGPVAYDPYGRPIMPPPGPVAGAPMMMMPPAPPGVVQPPPPKRSRADEDESNNPPIELEEGERLAYPVKKYRPDSYYRSIEAFSRYTKSHRMLDAAYVRIPSGKGGTPEKPVVFGIKIAGSFLAWGRGRTRDAAIDASIRAAFALVAAHGYDDFQLTEDCFAEEPQEYVAEGSNAAPMPPPPPPPPAGMYGMMPPGMGGVGGAPPLPPGMPPPPLPPGMPPPCFGAPPEFAAPPPSGPDQQQLTIPQPAAPSANLSVASAVVPGGTAGTVGGGGANSIAAPTAGTQVRVGVSLGGSSSATNNATVNGKGNGGGGDDVVFGGGEVDEEREELSMEEKRMQVGRYWTLVAKALARRDEQ